MAKEGKLPKATMGHLLAKRPLEAIAVDFTVLEPASSGVENVLVFTDVFNKFTHAIPTRDQKARTVTQASVKECLLGLGYRCIYIQTRDGTLSLRLFRSYVLCMV